MMSDCGCEARRQWLIDRSPGFVQPLWHRFDAAELAWDVIANLVAVAILYYLLRVRKNVG